MGAIALVEAGAMLIGFDSQVLAVEMFQMLCPGRVRYSLCGQISALVQEKGG